MSTGPIGGEPVPSIKVAPRSTNVLNGPAPSPGFLSGAGLSSCPAEAEAIANAQSSEMIRGVTVTTNTLFRSPPVAYLPPTLWEHTREGSPTHSGIDGAARKAESPEQASADPPHSDAT